MELPASFFGLTLPSQFGGHCTSAPHSNKRSLLGHMNQTKVQGNKKEESVVFLVLLKVTYLSLVIV